MSYRARSNQLQATIDGPEATAYASDTGLFAGSEVTGRLVDLNADAVDFAWVEDDRVKVGGGADEEIQGLAYESLQVTCTTHMEGLGTPAPAGQAATQGFVGHLVSSAFQSAPDLTTGSDVDDVGGTPSTVLVPEVTAGAHALSLASIGLALISVGSQLYWRPYTYDSPDLELLMALPSAPTGADVVYGTATYPFVDSWPGQAVGYSIGLQLANLEGGVATDFQLYGGINDFEIAEAQVGQIPKMSHTVRFAGFDDLIDLSAGTEESAPGTVVAGMDVIIGAFGSTALESKCIDSWSFKTGRTYEWNPCASRANPFGVSGVMPGAAMPELTLTFKRGETPPAAIASGATSYRQSKRAGGDRYHVMIGSVRGGPGRAAAIYMPDAVLGPVKQINVGNRTAEQVTFRPRAGSALPLVLYGRG